MGELGDWPMVCTRCGSRDAGHHELVERVGRCLVRLAGGSVAPGARLLGSGGPGGRLPSRST